jgi:hypothetical protein
MRKIQGAIAAACLAAATLATMAGTAHAAGTAQAAGHRPAGSQLTACQKWAKAHTFVWIKKATESRKGVLTVTGDRATVYCGGPDDFHYIVTNKQFTGHLLPSAKINVLVFGNSGIEFPRLAQAKFPHWVATDHNSGIYAVTGPFKAIRALAEEYHP